MNYQGKVKFQVWLLILVVFLLGGVTGASIDRLYMIKSSASRPNGPGPNWRQMMIEDMRRDLNLSDEQVTQVRTIYEQTRKEFQPRRMADCPAFKEMRELTRTRINAILSPEQQKRYAEFLTRREAEMNEREKERK